MRDIRRIVVHHSASSLLTTREEIHKWHTSGHGWSDIGYHGVIEATGLFVPGRPLDKMGAHAKGANGDSLGLCIVGNNTEQVARWTKEQLQTADQVLEVWLWMWPQAEVFGHRDVGSTATACPGVDVSDVFSRLMR